MRHPFCTLTRRQQHAALVALAAAAGLLYRRQHTNVKTEATPHGMLSFALAGDAATADGMRRAWDGDKRAQADRNLRTDMLFSLAWTNAIALADLLAAEELARRGWSGRGLGEPLAWGQAPAGALAVGKDLALLTLLRGKRGRPLGRFGRWLTVIEIASKGTGLLYAGAGATAWLARRT